MKKTRNSSPVRKLRQSFKPCINLLSLSSQYKWGRFLSNGVKYVLLLGLTFPLVGCPPFPVIISSPHNSAHFELGEEITFTGSAKDFQDGELTGDSLVWTSDQDGQIGTGTFFTRDDLSEGKHKIMLTATNSQEEERTATITITISGGTSTTTTLSSTTIASDACPPDYPIDCGDGQCCPSDYPICCPTGCCPLDYPICGEGEDEGYCFPEESTTTTTMASDPGAIVLSTDAESDLLFYIIHEDGSGMYYYGFSTSSGLELTHVISDDGTIVIFNEDLIPIQWISNGLTVVVYREDSEQPFEPHSAYHEVLYDGNEDSFTIDIYPENLPQIIINIETYTGQQFNDVSTFLTAHNISSFNSLLTLAKQNSQEQARYIAAAVGFSAASAFLSMEAEGLGSRQFSSIMPLQYNYLVKVIVGLLASKFNDAFGPGSTDPDGPVVEVALCRGVAKFGICHYLFFHMEDYGMCIEKCLTSMRCFTDICMPGYTISAEAAKKCRDHYMGGG